MEKTPGRPLAVQEMYEEGYHSITNIDLCMTVIKAMQEKDRDKPGCLMCLMLDHPSFRNLNR